VSYTSIRDEDDGTGGDAVAGDGVYSATIPGQASGTLIASASRRWIKQLPRATALFPTDAPTTPRGVWCASENYSPWATCLLPTVMTAATLNTWTSRAKLDNTPLDVTFVLAISA